MIYSELPFCLKIQRPPSKNDDIALILVALIHIQVYTACTIHAAQKYLIQVLNYHWASCQQDGLFQDMREIWMLKIQANE